MLVRTYLDSLEGRLPRHALLQIQELVPEEYVLDDRVVKLLDSTLGGLSYIEGRSDKTVLHVVTNINANAKAPKV
jgi:hypothetical protein